jgi:two-component system, cell cycle sensor histidine kinase PleC
VALAKAQKVPEASEGTPATAALIAALDCLRIAITVYDSSERLIYANQHFDYLFRVLPPRATLIGQRYGDIVQLEAKAGVIAPEALSGGVDIFVARRRAQLTSGDFRPIDLLLADGRVVEIKSRRTPEGGWIALWTDVTAARQAMGRLEDAIELSADAFAFFDRNDKLVVCNKDYATLHGRSVDEMRGSPFREVIESAVERGLIRVDCDAGDWIARRLSLHGTAAGAMTLEMSDGIAYLLRDRRTNDGHVVVLTDVTDERRVEAALAEQSRTLAKTQAELATSKTQAESQARYLADLTQRLDQAAASADTTKKTLLRTMSHELKTPLNAIIGFSDLLGQMADRFNSGQVREYAALIHAGGRNLLRLINNILDLTKIAAGKFEARAVRLDAGSALWSLRDDYAERADTKEIRIDADGCPMGLTVEVDESAFAQMLNQLMDNAITFTPQGGAITLCAERGAERVRLTVADNGPGVATQDLARILEPFEQVGRSTTDHTHGAGLGLTLVKAFAELHGGALMIESEPGKGFAATIELPAAP